MNVNEETSFGSSGSPDAMNVNSSPVAFPPPVRYVLSSHADFNGNTFELPPNFEIQFYSEPGTELFCSRHLQTQVCMGTARTVPAWKHSGQIGDYTLTADEYNPSDIYSFLSGIKDCERNVILFNLTRNNSLRRAQGEEDPYRTLSECVAMIEEYHDVYHRGRSAVLHFLACRTVADNANVMINAVTGLPAIGGKRKRKHRNKSKKSKSKKSKRKSRATRRMF